MDVVLRPENPYLVHVAKLRVSVSELLDLSIRFTGKTVVALARVTLLVLPFRVGNAKASEKEGTDLAAQIDSVSSRVLGRLLGSVCPRIC